MSTGTVRGEGPESVLVLGAGFIGSQIVHSLLDNGHRVRILARSRPRGLAGALTAGAEVVVGDAGVAETVEEAIAGIGHVVFALGSLMPAEAEHEPQLDLTLTLQPLFKMLDLLGQGPRLPISYVSSGGTVYGRVQSLPVAETAPTVPVSAYGITRLTAERLVLRYGAMHSVGVRVLRVGNAYGTGQSTVRGQGVIGTVLEQCWRGDLVVVYGDGRIARDFVHIEDVGQAIAALVATSDGPPVVNIASGTATSVIEVVELAQQVSGRRVEIVFKDPRSFDVPHIQLDISLLQSLVEYHPRSLLKGMEQIWLDMTTAQQVEDAGHDIPTR